RQHLAAAGLQQPDSAVEAGQGDPPAVGAEGDGAAPVRVALLVDLPPPRGRVPDLDHAVQARPAQSPRVRTKIGTERIREAFAGEPKRLLARCQVPDLDRAVVTGR